MYQFRDTVSGLVEPNQIADLPTEAMQVNGEYLEHRVHGYRTLYVKGREQIETELSYYDSALMDGATRQGSRHPVRELTIGYQLVAPTAQEFREAYNVLLGILDTQDAQLIFRDEPDKYFVGTKTSMGDVQSGRNAVAGEFTVLCLDPKKYSVLEKTVSIDGENAEFYYRGTASSFPTLIANFTGGIQDDDGERTSGSCGYVTFTNSNGATIFAGNGDDADEEQAAGQTLVDREFKVFGRSTEKWVTESATIQTYGSNTFSQAGTPKIAHDGTKKNLPYLVANSYGTASDYNGLSITRTLGAASSDWTLEYKQRFCMDANKTGQRALFQAAVTNDSLSVPVAAVLLRKSGSGTKGEIRMYVNGSLVNTKEISLIHTNSHFGFDSKAQLTTVIKKTGNKISFDVAGEKFTAKSSAVETVTAEKISFYFAKRKGYDSFGTNGLYSVLFKTADVNYFVGGDSLQVGCESGEITVNDKRAPEYGRLSNDWENFFLSPGENVVSVQYSDGASRPEFLVRYREAYL